MVGDHSPFWTRAIVQLKRAPDWSARLAELAAKFRWDWSAVLLLWFVLIVPAISLRGYHYEEGTVIALARGALENGNWLEPHHYGNRFIERPVLMSWLIAALGAPFGTINQWVARAPTVLSLLAGALLVFLIVRKRASASAALFSVVCVLVSPMLLQKLITAEPDILVSVLLFAAFVIWWQGNEAGRFGMARWLMLGLVLAAAGLTKGPQPLAYFSLGVGAFVLIYRQWSQIPGLVLAHAIAGAVVLAWYVAVMGSGDMAIWLGHSRISNQFSVSGSLDFLFRFSLELLPGLILLVAGVIATMRPGFRKAEPLVIALLLFGFCAVLVLLLWPGARTRYAMPSILAASALAGLMYDRLRAERLLLVNATLFLAICLASYQLVIGWLVMPLFPSLFQTSRNEGLAVTQAMAVQPATLYVVRNANNNNLLAYVPSRIVDIPFSDFATVQAPSWALIPTERTEALRAMRPDLTLSPRAILRQDDNYQLLLLSPR